MIAPSASRGWQGAVLKAMGAPDFTLTVTDRTDITPHYVRLGFSAGGLLTGRSIHPTMWIRLWFPNGKRMHQRGYTILNPDATKDSFDIEFAMHNGPAANWARTAQPGDSVTATVMGSKFALPQPPPAGYLIIGDTASLPAINTLLAASGDVPARVWLEYQHDDDPHLPLAATPHTQVTWIRRQHAGGALEVQIEEAAFDATSHFGWVACDMATTRAISKILRERYRIDRKHLKAQAYWVATSG